MKLKVNRDNKFLRVAIIIYSILSLGCTVYLIFQPKTEVTESRFEQTEKELTEIKKYLNEHDLQFRQRIDSLNTKNDSLQKVIEKTSSALKKSKVQVVVLKQELLGYIGRYSKDTSLVKNKVSFDSLAGLSIRYTNESTARDSLYDDQVHALEQVVIIKDIAFKNCDSLLKNYREATDTLLHKASGLNEQLRLTQKENKKRRRWNRLLSAAALVLSGAVISGQLLNH